MLCLQLAKTRSDWWSFKRPVFYAFQVELITIEKQSAGNRRAISSSTEGSQKKEKRKRKKNRSLHLWGAQVPTDVLPPFMLLHLQSYGAKYEPSKWPLMSFHPFIQLSPNSFSLSGSTVPKAAGSNKGTNTELRKSYSLVVFALERHMKV